MLTNHKRASWYVESIVYVKFENCSNFIFPQSLLHPSSDDTPEYDNRKKMLDWTRKNFLLIHFEYIVCSRYDVKTACL